MATPTVGTMVHFVLNGEAASIGQHRPAFVLKENGNTPSLRVLTSVNDGDRYATGIAEFDNATEDEIDKMPGTWHLPE